MKFVSLPLSSNAKEESCFFPIPQAADCILRIIEKANAPVVYLSTDAADSETNLLQSLVAIDDKQIPLVKRPGYNSAEKWDSLLYRNHLDGDRQVTFPFYIELYVNLTDQRLITIALYALDHDSFNQACF